MGRHDWYRLSTWTDEDRRNFRARLERSRGASSRSQYLRIQALHLAEATPPCLEGALELLDEFLRDYPTEATQLSQAHAQRGSCLARLGRHDEALAAFQSSLAAERRFPYSKCDAYLDYADLVVQAQRTELYKDALAEINKREPGGPFPIQQYRIGVAKAFLCEALGRMAEARDAALRAIAASGETQSPFQYHRDLGIVTQIDDGVQARLWRLAGTQD